MDSLKAFLSPCVLVNVESDAQVGNVTVLWQNDQPARVFDRTGQSQSFEVTLVPDPEMVTEEEVATLVSVAEQTKWIVVVDHSNQVRGVIEPQSAENLQIAARITIRQGEFGSTTVRPLQRSKVPRDFPPNQNVVDPRALREWWHEILRNYGRYRCYAFFLCLPSNKEAVNYINTFGEELDQLSHENCLVITLSKRAIRRSGYDKAFWNLAAVNEQISKGYSITVADHFKISYSDFPCIVLFEDIRSTKPVVVPLINPETKKELEADEIAKKMTEIFRVIQEAVASEKEPVFAVKQNRNLARLKQAGGSGLNKLFDFMGKSFATALNAAIEAWIDNWQRK